MHDDHEERPGQTAGQAAAERGAPAHLDRRGFFRGAALLGVGSLGGTGALAQTVAGPGSTGTDPAAGAAALESQTQRAMRWLGREPADWVRRRTDVDHDVAIVGGGQSGVAIAYGLRRKGVGRVTVIDRAAPGRAGIWRTIARMHQLRTPKTLAGPEQANPALGFRAWYETLNGPEAFDALDRIPRLAWADYLDWFQRVTGTTVRYRTRLLEIEPAGEVLRLHLEADGARRVETARKVVLANGYAGAGGPSVPDFLRALPAAVWTHTANPLDAAALAGKVVAVIGAGSSAFDAAAVALESGAAEVHLFSRRSYIDYPAPPSRPGGAPVDRGHPNVLELTYELPDAVRWRNFLLGDRRPASVPLDSIERVMGFDGFRVHLERSWRGATLAGGRVVADIDGETWRFDHVIAGTGYQIDLAAQPELARIHDSIALWRDRFRPAPGEESAAGGRHPYLGPGFEFLPRDGSGADFLRNIHCFNLAASLSFGKPVGDIPSAADHPRLVTAIARDLYVASVDSDAHERFFEAPLVPADPAPYRRAIARSAREVA